MGKDGLATGCQWLARKSWWELDLLVLIIDVQRLNVSSHYEDTRALQMCEECSTCAGLTELWVLA